MNRIKPPIWQRTYTLIRRLADHVTFGTIASKCGKEVQTAEAWGREPESNENPNGNGKKNPFDTVLRLIGMAHKEDAGLAREIAEMFPEYVEFLDRKLGLARLKETGSLCEVVGKSAKEHTDIVLKMLQNPNPDYHELKTEYEQAMSALIQVGACIDEEIKKELQQDYISQPLAAGGNGR